MRPFAVPPTRRSEAAPLALNAFKLGKAAREVDVLHRLRGGTLEEVVDARHEHKAPRGSVPRPPAQSHAVAPRAVALHIGRLSLGQHTHEALAGVIGRVALAQGGARHSASGGIDIA